MCPFTDTHIIIMTIHWGRCTHPIHSWARSVPCPSCWCSPCPYRHLSPWSVHTQETPLPVTRLKLGPDMGWFLISRECRYLWDVITFLPTRVSSGIAQSGLPPLPFASSPPLTDVGPGWSDRPTISKAGGKETPFSSFLFFFYFFFYFFFIIILSGLRYY